MQAATATPRAVVPIELAWPELLAQRAYLVRFAQRRLHDPALAEDAVQDVFEAVLSGRARFAGEAALRTWLTGVLKHKVADLRRRRAGLRRLESQGEGAQALDVECPQPRPDELAEQRQRLRQTLRRIDALPSGLRDAVRLRVLHDQPTEQVCRTLSISEGNLFVRLHRARQQLAS
jgi:RNA polymerase sigma-70 factor (ECF subfamily)